MKSQSENERDGGEREREIKLKREQERKSERDRHAGEFYSDFVFPSDCFDSHASSMGTSACRLDGVEIPSDREGERLGLLVSVSCRCLGSVSGRSRP